MLFRTWPELRQFKPVDFINLWKFIAAFFRAGFDAESEILPVLDAPIGLPLLVPEFLLPAHVTDVALRKPQFGCQTAAFPQTGQSGWAVIALLHFRL